MVGKKKKGQGWFQNIWLGQQEEWIFYSLKWDWQFKDNDKGRWKIKSKAVHPTQVAPVEMSSNLHKNKCSVSEKKQKFGFSHVKGFIVHLSKLLSKQLNKQI